MRLARDLGSVRELFPAGITSVTDLPHTLFRSIVLALGFLGFEELESDEQPPKRLWLDQERLSEHFDAVKKRREAKYGGDGKQAIDDPVENDAKHMLMTK